MQPITRLNAGTTSSATPQPHSLSNAVLGTSDDGDVRNLSSTRPPLLHGSQKSDDGDDVWDVSSGHGSLAASIANGDDLVDIDVRSHLPTPLPAEALHGIGGNVSTTLELFEEAEAARVVSAFTYRVNVAATAATRDDTTTDGDAPTTAHAAHFLHHAPDAETTNILVRMTNMDSGDEPYTPHIPVSPLSIGIGDRYTMLNVRDPQADAVARSYSQLSRRGGASVTSGASGGGGGGRPSGVASPVMSLPPSRTPPRDVSPVAHQTRNYFQRLQHTITVKRKYDPYPIAIGWDLVPTFVLSFTAFVILGVLDLYLVREHFMEHMSGFMPTFGGGAAILFGLPKSPFAQPRNFFFGQIAASVLGISAVQATRSFVETKYLADLVGGCFAVVCVAGLMMFLNLMHPSSCATAIFAAQVLFLPDANDRGYLFVVAPVLLGCVILFLVAWLGNNLFASRSPYPMYW